jgi:hypothetical protein
VFCHEEDVFQLFLELREGEREGATWDQERNDTAEGTPEGHKKLLTRYEEYDYHLRVNHDDHLPGGAFVFSLLIDTPPPLKVVA